MAENQVISVATKEEDVDLRKELDDIVYNAGRALIKGDTSKIVSNKLAMQVYNAMIVSGLGGGGGGVGTVVPTFVTGIVRESGPNTEPNFWLVPVGNNVYQVDAALPRGKDGVSPTIDVTTDEEGASVKITDYRGEQDEIRVNHGVTPKLVQGTTTTLPAGSPADVRVVDNGDNTYSIDVDIPSPRDGVTPVFLQGTTTTTLPGTDAKINVVDNGDNSYTVDAEIPRGDPGVTPIAQVVKANGTATIEITDVNGTTRETVSDGISPVANVVRTGDTSRITITDVNGTTTADVKDGVTPVANVVKKNDTAVITITDAIGTTVASVKDGFSPSISMSKSGGTATIEVTHSDGTTSKENILDGVTPTASVEKIGDTATITITDDKGTTTAQVKDGFSPTITVTKVDEEITITATDKNGTTSQTVTWDDSDFDPVGTFEAALA